jgi:multiple antibiotic resistance protein
MTNYIQAIVTVLSLVNPAVCAMMFSQAEAGGARREQIADSIRVCLAVLVILSLAALFGVQILHVFGISLDAFNVAGGGVLALIGFQMLRGGSSHSAGAKDAPSSARSSLSGVVMFAASPGTITGVITLAAAHTGTNLPVTTLVAVAVAVAVTWCVLLLTALAGGHRHKDSLVRDTVTSFMGLIVIAMGVQLGLTGYRAFMAPAT